ncbi:Arc family DNA-binding protein [Gilliamella sp. B3023]|uniref:Arc family DNA-binding protein n=1 Tax=Gilliamella sp. B3023 TaxID=2817987 RepID=UPI00226A5503|nr:Arc family DNA-binding protein [Gilliamella sp. B3023]MCX8675886.1 Arc family DNA-binding protein [Gilliamella sp. B3023]
MEKKFPSQLQDKFTVRFPEGMRDKIAELAKKNGRSMNNEIIAALDDHISKKLLDSNSEKLINSLSFVSMDSKNEHPIEYKGALEILKMLDEKTNEYRSKLLRSYLSFANDILHSQNKK